MLIFVSWLRESGRVRTGWGVRCLCCGEISKRAPSFEVGVRSARLIRCCAPHAAEFCENESRWLPSPSSSLLSSRPQHRESNGRFLPVRLFSQLKGDLTLVEKLLRGRSSCSVFVEVSLESVACVWVAANSSGRHRVVFASVLLCPPLPGTRALPLWVSLLFSLVVGYLASCGSTHNQPRRYCFCCTARHSNMMQSTA